MTLTTMKGWKLEKKKMKCCIKKLYMHEFQNLYLQFIKFFAETLKTRFPDKLEKCFVYDVSFVFYQCYSIISNFLDKKTQQKIQLIKQKTRNSF